MKPTTCSSPCCPADKITVNILKTTEPLLVWSLKHIGIQVAPLSVCSVYNLECAILIARTVKN